MFKTVFVVLFIGININLTAQVSEFTLMGKWKVTKVNLAPELMNNEEANNMLTAGYTGAVFHFKGDRIFELTYPKKANSQLKEFNPTGENWRIHHGKIEVGTESNFNSLQITVGKDGEQLLFLLPLVGLEVEQIKQEKPKKYKKGESGIKNKSLESIIPRKPVIINREISEVDIIDFDKVTITPAPPNCDYLEDSEERSKCTANFMARFVARKFDTRLAERLNIVGEVKIKTSMVIDTAGQIVNIKADGLYEELNKHAIEVIAKLPIFIPAMKDGKAVNVNYNIPIKFKIVD